MRPASGPPVRLRTTVSFGPAGAPDAGEAWVVERGLPLAARTVDLAAALPPRLSSLSLARADGRLVASWSKAGADPALDGAILSIRWLASGARSWAVVLPPGTTSFAFPRLPPALAEFAPAPQVQPAVSVSAYGFEETRGWDEFRTTAPVVWLGGLLVVLDLSMDRGAWTSSGSILPEIVPVPAALRTPAAAAVHPATAAAR